MLRTRSHRESSTAASLALVALLVLAPATRGDVPVVPPARLGLSEQQLARIDQAVEDELQAGRLPGCVVAVGRSGGIGFLRAYGRRQIEPSEEPMTVDTVFDMASLTKPVATATSVMILVEQGRLRLRNPVAEYLPDFGQEGKQDITVEDLLVHRGGLIPDNSLDDYRESPAKAWERLFALPAKDPGKKFVYSDVGFLALGKVVEAVSGQTVAEFSREHVFQPLGMSETGFTPDEALRNRAAPSERRDGRWLRGEVHDPRAALLDGVAGHAGLFSTAADLAKYCDSLLETLRGSDAAPRIMSPATLAEMLRPREIAGHRRALGWDSRSGYSTNRGELFSDRAFGHGGFTGTAMWIDPELDLYVIFLSNRLHPDGKGSVNPLAGRIGTIAAAAISGNASPRPVRQRIAATLRAASRATLQRNAARRVHAERGADAGADAAPQAAGEVLTGIDVLVRDDFKPLRGRRVGLITNHTGLDRSGRRTIDLLFNAPEVELVALFSPEHGIAGKLDFDGITGEVDAATGLKVYSLYDGPTRRPRAEQLKNLDVLVFDIQDVGARFYTYMSTMAWAMEAAAERGVKYVVLDRPNPIGGVAVEGPLADNGRESFVGFHTIAVRHGMTVGELARMYRGERDLKVDLEVVRCEGWRRGDYWDATGLMWVNPSPNMRSLAQAVLYPGMGIWETTNVSVGRGTDTPFEILGAPWIDAKELAAALNAAKLPGVCFTPVEFTPDDSKFKGEKCGGVNAIVTDRAEFRPVDLALELACTLRRLYGHDWQVKRADRLLINARVHQAIIDGRDRAEIESMFSDDLKSFLERREPFLLYEE